MFLISRDALGLHVILPSHGFESDRVGVLVEDEGAVDSQVHDHETLCTNAEGQNFDGVADEEGRHGDVVEEVVEEDESEDTTTSCLVGDAGWVDLVAVRVERTSSVGVDGRADSPACIGQAHSNTGGEEESSSTKSLNHKSTEDSGSVVVNL